MSIDPISLATVAKVASTAAAGFSAISGMNAASYQASVAERNAKIAEQNAQRAANDSQLQQMDQDEMAAQDIGALIAAQSASGLSLDTGSSLLRRRRAQELSRRDASRIREQGDVNVRNFQQQAGDFKSGAQGARATRRNRLLSGVLNTGSTYIGGAQQVRKVKARVANLER